MIALRIVLVTTCLLGLAARDLRASAADDGDSTASSEHSLVTGWLMMRGAAQVRVPSQPPELQLPFQRASGGVRGLLRARYRRGGSLEVTISGQVAHDQAWEANDFYSRRSVGDSSSELRELEVSWWGERVSFHLGQQRVAWGVTDMGSPNDVLNARDLGDPIFTESELRYLPTPMARLDMDVGAFTLELVAGAFVPDTFTLIGHPWSVIQPSAPVPVRGLLHQLGRLQDSTIEDRFEAFVRQTSLPWRDPRDGTASAKVSTKLGGFDVDGYYQYGYDGTPLFRLDRGVEAALAATDWTTAKPADFASVFGVGASGTRTYDAAYLRRHHVGLDAVTTVGPWALRLDSAYQTRRVFYRTLDLSGVASRTVAGVASAEFQTGDVNKVVIVDVSYLHLLDDPGGPLLGYAQTAIALSSTIRWALTGNLTGQLQALLGVHPRTLVVNPELAWRLSSTTIVARGVFLEGADGSFGGYFRYASGAMLGVRANL